MLEAIKGDKKLMNLCDQMPPDLGASFTKLQKQSQLNQ